MLVPEENPPAEENNEDVEANLPSQVNQDK